jgi:hypothetical protein
MKDARVVRAWALAAVLVGLAMSACAPKVARRQTDIMESVGKVAVSGAVLRGRVNDLVDRFAGRIEETADRIDAETRTGGGRRRGVALKVDVIPAVYTAGYRVDPLAAAIDVWALAFQLDAYMDTGPARGAFGSHQELVQATVREVIADADTVVRSVVIRPEHFDQARSRVETWARAHPISYSVASRPSSASVLAELRSDEQDAFQAVGSMSDTVEALSERLNTYAMQLPKQARWHSEILASELAAEMAAALALDRTLGDVHDVGAAARSASEVLKDLSRLFDVEREILETERRSVLAGIDQQRLESLGFVTAERHALVAAARDERLALVAALRQERIEAIAEVDAIKTRAIVASLAGLKDLVDYAFWRVAVLLASLVCLAAVFAALALALVVRRARVPVTP